MKKNIIFLCKNAFSSMGAVLNSLFFNAKIIEKRMKNTHAFAANAKEKDQLVVLRMLRRTLLSWQGTYRASKGAPGALSGASFTRILRGFLIGTQNLEKKIRK